MNDKVTFILKVAIASAILSALIKYAGPYLSIPASPVSALTLVFAPLVGVSIALWQRWRQSTP